jgi:hypothetical protein
VSARISPRKYCVTFEDGRKDKGEDELFREVVKWPYWSLEIDERADSWIVTEPLLA